MLPTNKTSEHLDLNYHDLTNFLCDEIEKDNLLPQQQLELASELRISKERLEKTILFLVSPKGGKH